MQFTAPPPGRGSVNAGSPVIKVQCRNSVAIDLHADYMTNALTVAILG